MLGKKPYVHDPRTLRLEKYAISLPPPPPWVNWETKASQPWGSMLNDQIGCCTCSCAGHMIQSWTADNGSELTVADSDVLTAYSDVSGYDPMTGQNDNGAMISDVLKYWQKTGVGGHKIDAYASIDPSNHTLLRQAIDLFGGVDMGIQLPVAAQNMSTHWKMWGRTPAMINGDWAPGSWGGHCVAVLAYNELSYVCVSWGELIRIDLDFWNNYVDEAWAVLSPDFFNGNKSASGLDLTQLQNDLSAL